MSQSPSHHQDGRKWQLHQAKAQFSHLIDLVQKDGMQVITKNGEEVAIIMSSQDYRKYAQPEEPLSEFFMRAPCPEVELDIRRSKESPREIDL